MSVSAVADHVASSGRLTPSEALELYMEAPTSLLGQLADRARQRRHPEGVVTYIIDRNPR